MREEFSTVVVIDQLRNALDSLKRDAAALSGGSSLMTRTGEYVAIDLDENNAHTRREWAERHPGETSRSFGWGVCRHGHGLQDHGQDRGVVLTEAQARAWADQLNPHLRVQSTEDGGKTWSDVTERTTP